ncbi:GNAT family N-acetyltransferase [Nocardioides sp. Leaf285]|uniref:GNAT family N-acetyltransferase n=1 Tax=Nocardioides sp. Leaf285 TaxID=1736322 RepID=UPI001F41AF20|nr:GNAT family protein [Nocardioides sp. Leaf285]
MSEHAVADPSDPLTRVPWPVRTERLLLRRAERADVTATYAIRRRPEVHEWLSSAALGPGEYAAMFTRPQRLATSLVVERCERPGVVVGDLMLAVEDAWAQTEVADRAAGTQARLGWVLDPAYGGQGLATEAVGALLGVCFDALGLRRVVADCFADNTPSWRLMERVGMRREARTVGDSLHRSRGWLDGLTYALLAEEWRARS